MKMEKVHLPGKDQHALDLALDLPQEAGWTVQPREEQKPAFWRVLQQWSECSRLCGGGFQYLQRECVGTGCQGDPILKQECNPQACPGLEVKSTETRLEEVQVVQNRSRL